MKIDFHSHYYPKKYIRILETSTEDPRIVETEDGKKTITSPRYNQPVQSSMYDLDEHLKNMDMNGINIAVLSLASPWDYDISPARWIEVATAVNDGIAEAVHNYPERFVGLATLPYNDTERALEELDRAVNTLNMKGITIPTHINGKRLDAKEFLPLYEKLTKLDLPMFIHPTVPVGLDSLNEPLLMMTMAFPFETTITITRMLVNGVFEKFPKLKIVAAHLGGTFPYLVGRITRGANLHTQATPNTTEEQLRRIYLDTCSFHEPSIICAYEFHGPEKLLLGSDYPYGWCTRTEAHEMVQKLRISESARNRILAGNVKTLLKLKH